MNFLKHNADGRNGLKKNGLKHKKCEKYGKRESNAFIRAADPKCGFRAGQEEEWKRGVKWRNFR